jgi:hypothetical protein
MKVIKNRWRCTDIPCSEKLAVFNSQLKCYLETRTEVIPSDSMIIISFTAGESGTHEHVTYDLSVAADGYNSCTMHAVGRAKLYYKEEYFFRAPNGIYNCDCTTKARDGILEAKLVTRFSVGDENDEKTLARKEWAHDILADIVTTCFTILESTVNTSYFSPKDVEESEELEEKPNGEDEE